MDHQPYDDRHGDGGTTQPAGSGGSQPNDEPAAPQPAGGDQPYDNR